MNRTRKDNNQQPVSISCQEESLVSLIAEAKTNFNGIFAALKSELVHYLFFSDRELLAGPKYGIREGFTNWGSQEVSIYNAGERLKVKRPRLRSKGKEVSLPIYEALSERSRFSQEILLKALSGITCRNYQGPLMGFSKSSASPSRVSPVRSSRVTTTQIRSKEKEREISSKRQIVETVFSQITSYLPRTMKVRTEKGFIIRVFCSVLAYSMSQVCNILLT